jgi:hypothetical protein
MQAIIATVLRSGFMFKLNVWLGFWVRELACARAA